MIVLPLSSRDKALMKQYDNKIKEIKGDIHKIKNRIIPMNANSDMSIIFKYNFECALDILIKNSNTEPMEKQLVILEKKIQEKSSGECDKYKDMCTNLKIIVAELNDIVVKLHEKNKMNGDRIIMNEFTCF